MNNMIITAQRCVDQRSHRPRKCRRRALTAIAVAGLSAFAFVGVAQVNAATFYGTPGSTYAAQQTSYYCGEGTMQMILSATAVTTANPGFVMPTQNSLYNKAQAVQLAVSGFTIQGTLPSGIAAAPQGAANQGALPTYAAGNSWTQYINSNTLLGADQAERNIANAVAATEIPSGIVVHNGGHWDAVSGRNHI